VTGDLAARAHALSARLAQHPPQTERDADPAIDLAIDANAAGRGDIAAALLAPLTTALPRCAKLWQVLGLAYREDQQMVAALAAFEQAARLNARDPRIALGRAQITLEAGLPAADQFVALRRLAPGDPDLALSTASALMTEGRAEDAQGVILSLLHHQPHWVQGHEALVRFRAVMADGHPARGLVEAIAAHPDHLPLHMALYRACVRMADWDGAQAALSGARQRFGDHPAFDAAAAHLATETVDDDGAEALFAKAASVDDGSIGIARMRHALRTGRLDRAVSVGEAMIRSPAHAAQAWPYLGLAWRLMGDARAAWLDGDPPFFSVVDLGMEGDECAALAHVLRGLHTTRAHLLDQTVRGGTQTDKPLFHRLEPEIVATKARVTEAVRAYVEALPAYQKGHPLLGTPRGQLLYEGSWSVRLSGQGFHTCHTHPAGWISSALYVALPPADQRGPDPAGWLELGAPPADLRLTLPAYSLPAYARIEPKPGRLVLFPSTMWHATIPFEHGERLTIAFDVRTPRS
jgi:tetratricopeptide (TPR) repeat protein